jgi:hypothetical protein
MGSFGAAHCPLALMVSTGRLPDQENELDAPLCFRLYDPISRSHHNAVTLDSVIA